MGRASRARRAPSSQAVTVDKESKELDELERGLFKAAKSGDNESIQRAWLAQKVLEVRRPDRWAKREADENGPPPTRIEWVLAKMPTGPSSSSSSLTSSNSDT